MLAQVQNGAHEDQISDSMGIMIKYGNYDDVD